MHAHATGAGAPGFLALSGMWFVMMALMMAPTAWPWVRAFHSFGARSASLSHRIAATAMFVGGYSIAWLGYSFAAAALQRQITPTNYVGAGLLIGAGLFQFSSFKRACLTHCRSPFGYFLARWRNGPGGGFRIGFGHGVFCVGCCWAMMATALAAGMMNLWWMAALTLTAFAEQTMPYGGRLRLPIGLALVAAGLTRGLAFGSQ